MATTYQAIKVSSSTEQMPGIGDGQGLKCVSSTYDLSTGAAFVINDVVQSALIQSGSVVVDVMVVVTDLDSSTGITLDVGYGVDPDYFVAASTVGQAGGVVRASALTAKPLVLTTNDTIDVLVHAAATGTAATTGTVTITVFFLARNS